MTKDKKYTGVYKDTNNTYCVKTSFKTKDGFIKAITKRGFSTPKKAYDWKEENKIYYKNHFLYEIDGSSTPLYNMVEQYYKYKELHNKQTSISNLKYCINSHFVEYFKDKNISKLSAKEVNEYYLYIANKKLKNQSKNIIISNILDMIEYFDITEMIQPEVTRRFKRIFIKFNIIEQVNNDYLEKDEIEKLLNTFDNIKLKDRMYRLMFYTLIYSGLRKNEMLALTFKDIDVINNKLYVNKQVIATTNNGKTTIESVNYTKTNKNKVVVIPVFLSEMFLEFQQFTNRKSENLIFTIDGEFLNPCYPNRVLSEHLKMANVKNVKVHDLRHTYCTMLYDMEIDEQFVASQMGHSSTKTSHDIYEHMTKNRESKNSKLIENLK